MASNDTHSVWCVVPAAGVGARFGLDIPKQYAKVGDKTVFEETLTRLSSICYMQKPLFDRLVVCVGSNDLWYQNCPLPKLTQTVLGGDTRLLSVYAGVMALDDAQPQDWVMVHDVARPCITSLLVLRLYESLMNDPVGGFLGVFPKDTVKTIKSLSIQSGCHEVQQTIDRGVLVLAQTPQMFRYALLKEALELAIANNWVVTDESQAIEHMGYAVKIVPSESYNLKLTQAEDLDLIDFYCKRHLI